MKNRANYLLSPVTVFENLSIKSSSLSLACPKIAFILSISLWGVSPCVFSSGSLLAIAFIFMVSAPFSVLYSLL